MKTFATVIATGLLAVATTISSWAAGPPVVANFSVERGIPFGLVLDGRPVTGPATAQRVHLDYLAPGQHWADFSLPGPYGRVQRVRAAVWLEPGLETSFVLTQRPGYGLQLRQVSTVTLAGYGYPDQSQSQEPAYGQANSQPNQPGNDAGYGGPANGPVPPAGPQGPGYPTSPGYGGSPSYPAPAPATPNGDYAAPSDGYLQPLSPQDAADLAQTLAQSASDDERLDIANQALSNSSVRAAELAELVRTMAYDKSQQELAKFGYAHVSDPQNFYQVYAAFRFPASARKVQQALGLPNR